MGAGGAELSGQRSSRVEEFLFLLQICLYPNSRESLLSIVAAKKMRNKGVHSKKTLFLDSQNKVFMVRMPQGVVVIRSSSGRFAVRRS